MSFLKDFAGSMFTNIGAQMDEDRRLKLQMALEDRRRQYQIEDRKTARTEGKADYVDQQNATSTPFLGANGLMMERDLSLGEDGRISRSDRELGPAPVTPKSRSTQTTSAGKVSGTFMSDGSFVPDGDPLPPKAMGGNGPQYGPDGFTPAQRATQARSVESDRRRDRDALERAVGSRLTDIRAETKGLSTEVDDETGTSPWDDWLQQNQLPMGMNKTEAYSTLRKTIAGELAGEYGMEDKPKAAPKSESKPESKPNAGDVSENEALKAARAAINAGADRAAVIARLREMGIKGTP